MPEDLGSYLLQPKRQTEIIASAHELAQAKALLVRRDRLRKERQSLAADLYHEDPVAFVSECIKWKEDESPTKYQLSNLKALAEKKRVAIRGPHGLGKTSTSAWAILWFAITRDAAMEDWKIPCT